MENDFSIKTKPAKDKIKVFIEGNLSLANAMKIHEQFLDLTDKELDLEIMISNVVQMDLSFLQIFLSLIKNHEYKSQVEMSLTDELTDLMKGSGLFDIPALSINNSKQ